MRNINTVSVTGNLTRDPELRSLPSGTSVCNMRVAVNGSRKDSAGDWVEDPNFFNVTVWGKQGENCAQYLSKGRGVAIQGRLNWHEWETDSGTKRQEVDIVAEVVQFLDGKNGSRQESESSVPADTRDMDPQAAPASGGEDDIPF